VRTKTRAKAPKRPQERFGGSSPRRRGSGAFAEPFRRHAERSGTSPDRVSGENAAAVADVARPATRNGHLSPPRDLGRRWRRVRYNPIRNFTPERLTGALEQFDLGYLRDAALIWDVLERRDDVLKNAGPKRRKSVSRQAWEIVGSEDSPEAASQKEALEYFYRNLSVTDAINENLRAGFPQLVRGMMDAQFQYFAVHEVVWRPEPGGLTAELRKVPLWFFENRTGRLRYTGPELAWDGQDLDEGGWLITCGEGIMEAASVCCMFKRFSLQDWLNFGEKFGLPGIHGECPAAKGSAEWDDFTEALESFANDWIIATAAGSKISLIEAGKTGDAPFQPMVDRMDRRLAALCRGADLSSISRDREGTGASLQGDETDTLVEDDCALVTETLNEQIDRAVIRLAFGPGAPVLANIRINPPKKRDIGQDLQVDKFLLAHGAPVSVADALERYGRPAPDEGEELLRAPRREARPSPAGQTWATTAPAPDASNEAGPDEPGLGRFLAEARDLLATAMRDDLAPARDALRRAIGGDLSRGSLEALRDAMPRIMGAMDSGDTAAALEAIAGAALADGLAGGPEIAGENEFREGDHPRHPKGAPDGRGGKFAPKGDAEEGLASYEEPVYRPRGVDKTVPAGPGEPVPPGPRDGGSPDDGATVMRAGPGGRGERIPPLPGRGPRQTEFDIRANIQRGRRAMWACVAEESDVIAAMHRPELGDIDFVWDRDGRGISHIIRRRSEEDSGRPGMNSLSPEETLDKLVDVIARGSIDDAPGTAAIEFEGFRALLARASKKRNAWLISGFETRGRKK